MKRTDLAYTAGIIDGEGCISIYHFKSKTSSRGYALVLEVSVTNTNEWLIHWLHFTFGGNVGPMKSKRPRSRDAFYWRLLSKKAAEFLDLIMPYLKIKKPQAEIGIKFQEHHSKHKGRGHSKTQEDWIVEEAERVLIRSLNRRGREGEEV